MVSSFSDLKIFANSWPSISNLDFFSGSLEQFFHTVVLFIFRILVRSEKLSLARSEQLWKQNNIIILKMMSP